MATKKTNPDPGKGFDFEAALTELEAIVHHMEQGDTSLEQSLKDFERGIALTRQCQQALQQAEQKVQQLSADQTGLEAFDSDN